MAGGDEAFELGCYRAREEGRRAAMAGHPESASPYADPDGRAQAYRQGHREERRYRLQAETLATAVDLLEEAARLGLHEHECPGRKFHAGICRCWHHDTTDLLRRTRR